ncbi:MAG: DNA-protecting protein DprA [Micrococcaceae bacterium]|nr:DNA-protecting protein DprA [Micrococcaceae bacterium]
MADHDIRIARAGLTQVIEPADAYGVIASKAWGPIRLLEIIRGQTPTQQDWIALVGAYANDGEFTKKLRNKIGEAIQRWRRRSTYLNPNQALDYITSLGGHFIIPEDDDWPLALADLASTEPTGLWTLGDAAIPSVERVVGLVGSREATSYGDAATTMLATKARSMGLTVLSGGAYGIDAQAHRTALGTSAPGVASIAVLAGGLDRFYPAGNVELLHQIAADGLLVSELPPGMRPNRFRFLNRNRLIAALANATIVVEARYRSGALNTAHHAHDLGRSVGAVPGPVNVPTSAGCHRLIKETPTMLIDDPADLETMFDTFTDAVAAQQPRGHERAYDTLTTEEMLVFDALPVRGRTTVEHLCGITGLSVPRITGILAKLSRDELVARNEQGWRKGRDTIR